MIKLALLGTVIAAGTATIVVHPWSKSSTDRPAPTATSAISFAQRAPDSPRLHNLAPAPSGAAVKPETLNKAPEDMALLTGDQIANARLDAGPSRGNAKAPVTITVYTDMLCPYCGNSLGTIDQLMDEYPNKLRIVMKQMPVHAAAELPAEANYAADAQGKFWELHDLMMQHADGLPRELVDQLAQQAGLDMTKFDAALTGGTYKAAVDADMQSARDLELTGVPSFVINGHRIIGSMPIETFRATIDEVLAHPQT